VNYPVANLEEKGDTIYIRLYNHPEIESLDSKEIAERCSGFESFKIEIEQTPLHIVQLVHDLRQTGYKVISHPIQS
jgi:hypothetical protein